MPAPMGRAPLRALRVTAAAGITALGFVLAGCTVGSPTIQTPTPTPSVIITPSTSAPPVVSSPPPSVASSPSVPVLPAGCSQLLPLGTLDRILGFGVLGQVTYLRAAPVLQSGRTGRVTCSYGNPATATVGATPSNPTASASASTAPLVQVSYITYTDAAIAAARVQATVEADGASGVVTPTTVNGKPADIVIGTKSSELLMSDGARTLVVVVLPVVITPDKAPAALKAIAQTMLLFGQPPTAATAAAAAGSS
jgi:hypothetical protein